MAAKRKCSGTNKKNAFFASCSSSSSNAHVAVELPQVNTEKVDLRK